MGLRLRVRTEAQKLFPEIWDSDEEPDSGGFPCRGCEDLDRIPSKIEFARWLFRQARRRYPNMTLEQFIAWLRNWLDNHPNIRDRLPDGQGW
jgi:hypothetical protein